jgi:hypothetical protein
MAYVHGHATCIAPGCPMKGVNQAECCTGEVGCPIVAVRGPAPSPAPKGASDGARED